MTTSDMNPGGATKMIVVEGVEKWFDDFPALRGVDLVVACQEVVVVLGPSGSKR